MELFFLEPQSRFLVAALEFFFSVKIWEFSAITIHNYTILTQSNTIDFTGKQFSNTGLKCPQMVTPITASVHKTLALR